VVDLAAAEPHPTVVEAAGSVVVDALHRTAEAEVALVEEAELPVAGLVAVEVTRRRPVPAAVVAVVAHATAVAATTGIANRSLKFLAFSAGKTRRLRAPFFIEKEICPIMGRISSC
jgi:hypothetical protein